MSLPDIFIGYARYGPDYRTGCFVIKNLWDIEETSTNSLTNICDELCINVIAGKTPTFYDIPEDFKSPPQVDIFDFGSVRYLPLSPKDLTLLSRLYHSRDDMKPYPDPFLGVPVLN